MSDSKIVKRLKASLNAPPKEYAWCVRVSEFQRTAVVERYELIKFNAKTINYRDQFSDKLERLECEGAHAHKWFRTFDEAQTHALEAVRLLIDRYSNAIEKFKESEKKIKAGTFRAHNPQTPVIGKFKI